jgi:transcriptional regulator with GAF, ATPase, and Fis domain
MQSVHSIAEVRRNHPYRVDRECFNETDIVAHSTQLQEVLRHAKIVAPTESTVLIHGETGTGKEVIAQAIHHWSGRDHGRLVRMNVAAIPSTLLESELFGNERGAFTGAVSRRAGRLEWAEGGTLFLDEIGELPLDLQPKLLRLLQEREYERLGSNHTMRSTARLVAATHRDLATMVAVRSFREDLYYRLNVFPIYVPPLRDRRDDIPPLVRSFVQAYARRIGKSTPTISAAIMASLSSYPWPGNIRQLQNVIERAVILATEGDLEVHLPPLEASSVPPSGGPPAAGALDVAALIGRELSATATDLYAQTHREVDRLLLARVLEFTKGNHRQAAQILGVARQTMRVKLRALGLHVTQVVASDDDAAHLRTEDGS